MTTSEQVFHDTVTGPPPQGRVMELITSLWKTHVTAAIARLGVPDQLAGGPRTAAELAGAVPADAGAMARLLRAGAGLGLLEEVPPDRYALTALGECLVTGAGTFRDYAVMMTDPFQARPLEHFAQAITTGRPVAHAALGRDIWGYLREHPGQASHFAGAMTGLSAARAQPGHRGGPVAPAARRRADPLPARPAPAGHQRRQDTPGRRVQCASHPGRLRTAANHRPSRRAEHRPSPGVLGRLPYPHTSILEGARR